MQSFQNLQTDYIDLLLLHWPFANYYAAWRSLEELYADGKIKAIGVSNFEPDQLLDLIAYNNVVPAVNQIETNLYCQRSVERTWMEKKQVAHMAYAPLCQGNRNEMYQESAVITLAEKYGKTPAQILLRFLTQKEIAVIPRSTKPEHIRENIDIFDFSLSTEEMALLSSLDKKEPLGRFIYRNSGNSLSAMEVPQSACQSIRQGRNTAGLQSVTSMQKQEWRRQ